MIRLEIRLEIYELYTCRSTFPPPKVMYWIKKLDKIEPIGLRPPRNATAIPLNPIAGTEDVVVSQHSIPVRYNRPAPRPASAPEMNIVIIMFQFSFMPAYLAAW